MDQRGAFSFEVSRRHRPLLLRASFRALGDPLIAAQEADPSSQKVNPRLQSLGPQTKMAGRRS
jgi:hypothetical protein